MCWLVPEQMDWAARAHPQCCAKCSQRRSQTQGEFGTLFNLLSGRRESGQSIAHTKSCEDAGASLDAKRLTCAGIMAFACSFKGSRRVDVQSEKLLVSPCDDMLFHFDCTACRPIQIIVFQSKCGGRADDLRATLRRREIAWSVQWDMGGLRPVDGSVTPCCQPTGLSLACKAPDGPVEIA